MVGATYLVTGGAGFIGSHLTRALLDRGASVRVLDNLATGQEGNLATLRGGAEIIRGDLGDLAAVRAAVDGVDVVFHQGALASVPRSISDPLGSFAANVIGTQHVLLAACEAGVRRVVFASSSSLYGNTAELPTHEAMYPHPLSPYAVHKLTGELLCSTFTRNFKLETVALRYFNVFGPGQDPTSQYAAVIPRFLTALLEGRRPVVYGDGEQTRDFTYIANVVQANLVAADAPDAVGHQINIGCGARVSLNQVLAEAGRLLAVVPEPEYRDPRAGDVRDSVANIDLARRLLGYEPTISFSDGLALTLEALRPEHAYSAHYV